jgi:hypothetical protein
MMRNTKISVTHELVFVPSGDNGPAVPCEEFWCKKCQVYAECAMYGEIATHIQKLCGRGGLGSFIVISRQGLVQHD